MWVFAFKTQVRTLHNPTHSHKLHTRYEIPLLYGGCARFPSLEDKRERSDSTYIVVALSRDIIMQEELRSSAAWSE